MEDQCNTHTAVEEAKTSVGDGDAVVAEVAEDGAELQGKTFSHTYPVLELPSSNSTEDSSKEDGELSSLR